MPVLSFKRFFFLQSAVAAGLGLLALVFYYARTQNTDTLLAAYGAVGAIYATTLLGFLFLKDCGQSTGMDFANRVTNAMFLKMFAALGYVVVALFLGKTLDRAGFIVFFIVAYFVLTAVEVIAVYNNLRAVSKIQQSHKEHA